jgi:hypothetical protein
VQHFVVCIGQKQFFNKRGGAAKNNEQKLNRATTATVIEFETRADTGEQRQTADEVIASAGLRLTTDK